MYCTKCGKQNPDGNKFCEACGQDLSVGRAVPVPVSPAPQVVPQPTAQVAPAVSPERAAITQRAVIALIGSVLMLLGWFLPWFGLGGWGRLAGTILDLVDTGSFLGGLGGNWFGGAALGNGLQLSVFGILAGLVILFAGGKAAGLGLLVLLAIAPFIAILFLAINCLRHAWALMRRETKPYVAEHLALEESLLSLLKRVTAILVILAIYFVVAALVPGGLAILGGGFYLTAVGGGITMGGAQLLRDPIAKLVEAHSLARRQNR